MENFQEISAVQAANNPIASQSEQTTNDGTTVSTAAETLCSIDDLIGVQLERFYSLLYLYSEDDASQIARSVKPHGVNSWVIVNDKVTKIADVNAELQIYHDQIDAFVTIGKLFTIGEIIQTVSMVRRELKLKPYLKNILKSCVSDFLARHMAIPELSKQPEGSKEMPKVTGYTPTFNLNCQL